MPSTVLGSGDAGLNKTRHILSCEADFIIWETGQWGERGVCVLRGVGESLYLRARKSKVHSLGEVK